MDSSIANMSEDQHKILHQRSQEGEPSESDGSMALPGTDHELQKQVAQIAETIQRKTEQVKKQQEEESKHNSSCLNITYSNGREEEAQRQKENVEHPSLVKQVTSDPSVLYGFVNWESPGRTLGSFVIMMSLIISTRYFSPIKWILKILCIALGATSTLEILGRVTTRNTIMSRIRPRQYYLPSEATYSRLFSEIHEGVNIALNKLQKIIYVEDLTSTGIAFILSFLAYWLIEAIPWFWLAIIATLLLYTLGPLLTRQLSDPKATSWKPILGQKVHELRDNAVDTAPSVVNSTSNIMHYSSSKALDTASSATDRIAGATQDFKNHTVDTAQDLKENTMETAPYAAEHATEISRDVTNGAQDLAYSTTDSNMASNHAAHG